MTSVAAPRRCPPAGGYPRGAETRARIVAAALEVFGSEGFARGSTRKIAGLAGVPPPALQYYFDSKEGLHRACAQFIIDSITQSLAPKLREAEEALAAGGAERALEALCNLLESLVDYSLTTSDAGVRSRFMGRGLSDGAGPAFPLIRDKVSRPLHALCARLVAAVTGWDPQEEETRLRTIMALSPLTALHINRANTLATMNWTDFNPRRVAYIKAALRTHTKAALASR
jgi:AcrR family transcriptional regulator